MDTTDPLITFDNDGVCNYCTYYEEYVIKLGSKEDREINLQNLVQQLKQSGKNKQYDCIIGLSGGVDSSYLCWFAVKKLKLRPLVVHVDAGWNSELAVNNIQNIVTKLNIDLHTLVIDWNEIKDLQKAYFLSGVANLDVPQDHAFIASLYQEASKFKIKHILSGGNMQTESVLPESWGYDANDSKSLISIHKRFGSTNLKTYKTMSSWKNLIYYPYILKMLTHRPLEWIDYNKDNAKEILKNELGWRDYGGKHYESNFTKFFQAYYLPQKFGYDKRKAHLASLVISGQMNRKDAINELAEPIYNEKDFEEDMNYWIKKLGVSHNEFFDIMNQPPKFYYDYPNDEKRVEFINSILSLVASVKRIFVRKPSTS